MELTTEQFRKYNADYNEKYTDEVLTHGNGGFKTVTHRRTATRYALERLVADLEPSKVEPNARVESLVEYSHLGIYNGTRGTIEFYDESDDSATIRFDGTENSIWMDLDEFRRITE